MRWTGGHKAEMRVEQRNDLAFLDRHGDLIERHQGAVSPCHAVELEKRHGQGLGAARRSRVVASPQIPCGANRTKAMKIRPK